jgi:ketopantoate reductase
MRIAVVGTGGVGGYFGGRLALAGEDVVFLAQATDDPAGSARWMWCCWL